MHQRMLAMLLGLVLLPLAAWAATAELCFTATGLIDTIRISGIIETDDNPPTFGLNWVQEAQPLYRLKGPTVATPSFPVANTYTFTVYTDNLTTFFGNNPTCRTRVNLTPPPTPVAVWTGIAVIFCTDAPSPADPFAVTLNLLEQRPCAASLVSSTARTQALNAQEVGSAAGDPENNELTP